MGRLVVFFAAICARLILIICTASVFLTAREATAQCSAQDVLKMHMSLNKSMPSRSSLGVIQSAEAVAVWKTIEVGSFTDKFALLAALEAANCGVSDSVWNVFSRSGSIVRVEKFSLDLVVVSVAELGISQERPTLTEIYSRAKKLGFTLAPPDAGPQLRLQYFDQPMGEFLNVAMEPIKTSDGESQIVVVANGGAGLLLLSQDASATMRFFQSSQFVFVRSAIGEAER
jgi:hypothetical protein